MIHVAIIDDQQLLLDALESLLQSEADIQVTQKFSHPVVAETELDYGATQVVLLDINMPEKSGLEVCQTLWNKTQL